MNSAFSSIILLPAWFIRLFQTEGLKQTEAARNRAELFRAAFVFRSEGLISGGAPRRPF
jgi:hypothetical protein